MKKIHTLGLAILFALGSVTYVVMNSAPDAKVRVPAHVRGQSGVVLNVVPLLDCQAFRVDISESNLGEVTLMTSERVPPNFLNAPGLSFDPGVVAGNHRRSFVYSTSFLVSCFASRSGGDVFIAGHPIGKGGVIDETKTVIERWTFAPPKGAPFSHRDESTVAIGTPAPHSPLEVGVQGSVYAMPSQRSVPIVNRIQIATLNYPIYKMKADPDGRYLLILPDADRVEFLDLVAGATTPQVLLDVTAAPELKDASVLMFGIHASDGAKHAVVVGPDGGVAFVDADNDAVFETVNMITNAEFDLTYRPSAKWQDSFYRYGLSLF